MHMLRPGPIQGYLRRVNYIPSTVTVKMNTCGKTHKVTAALRDDGDIDITIESDCEKIQDYGRRLQRITPMDAMDFSSSRINDPEVRGNISAPCLITSAVFDVSWMELGLLSKNLCNKVKTNSLDFTSQ